MKKSKTAQLYDKHESTDFYDQRYAKGYMDNWPAQKKQKVQEVLLSLGLPSEGAVLDFGCGTGVLTELIAQTLPGWTVYGTDLSTEAISIAKERYKTPQFFVPGDQDFVGKTFDLVITHHVLEHVYSIGEALKEINDHLRPVAGMLHILPCGNEGSFCHQLCAIREGGIDPTLGNRFFFEDEGHVRRLTTDELSTYCAQQEFTLQQEFYTGHHFGAIDYFTKYEPYLIPVMTDSSQGIDAAAKRRIRALALYLRVISSCRRFVESFKTKWMRSHMSIRRRIRLSAYLPLYLVAMSVDGYITAKATKEWNEKKSQRNGDQMFLYFTRNG